MKTTHLLLFFLTNLLFLPTFGQDTILIIPFDQSNPNLPHPSYEGAPIALKASLRDATCNSYILKWDRDRDGDFSDESGRAVTPNGATMGVNDLGQTFLTPSVTEDTIIDVMLQLENTCTGQFTYATMKLFVHDFTPDDDPTNWTQYQVDVMSAVAAGEAMWSCHVLLASFGGTYNSSGITGSTPYNLTDPQYIKLFIKNGHLPAYPPGSINPYSMALPANWDAENDQRWNSDPYAETVTRMMNSVLGSRITQETFPIGIYEDSTIGYDASQNPIVGTKITGTVDGIGVKTTYQTVDRGVTSATSELLEALSYTLPALGGTPIQVGSQSGKSMEFVMQQMVDYLAWAQIDGNATGGWNYNSINGSTSYSLVEANIYIGAALGKVEDEAAGYGLVINNYLKYRVANAILQSQFTDGSARRFAPTAGGSGTIFSAGMIGVCRWLDIHNFSSADATVPFPNEAPGITRGQLKTSHDNYFAFLQSRFLGANLTDPAGWADGFWQNGDYLCSTPTGVHNQTSCMNIFGLHMLSEAFRVKSPLVSTIGSNDWQRMFNISLIRGQRRYYNASNGNSPYSSTGSFYQQYCSPHSWTCAYGAGIWSTALAGIVLTPTDFDHDYVIGCVRKFNTDIVTACETFDWIDGNTYTANNTIATHTYAGAANGCDSVVTLNLTILQPTTGTDVQSACVTFDWIDGNTYTSSNNSATHTLTGAAANGCDSIVTLDLTILQPTTGTDVQSACVTFDWIDGNTYTSSNNSATHTLTGAAANGCDSIVTLDLTILQPTTGTDVQTACATFDWIDGNTYTSSNNSATHTLTGAAANGCDSIVTLNLTINNVSDLTTSVSSTTITANNSSATYQWLDCDNNNAPLSGETSASFTATVNGNFAVELTENGCVDTSNCVNISTVGIIENTFANQMTLYPNPTDGEFYIDLGTVYQDLDVSIKTADGKVVFSTKFDSEEKINLSIANQPKGVYIVTISSDQNKAILRVVKNK
ncbi:MAG: T9SS type A sorting domain-containing protein [Crocinitomicaceae bacterium]|nr:T9SS type A sorting domain-containing protein [Crocinitomicaceae bacterium]